MMEEALLATFGGFADLLLRSTLLVALAIAAAFALRRASAVLRHLVWLVCILALLLLPVFMRLLPPLEIGVSGPVAEWLPSLPRETPTGAAPPESALLPIGRLILLGYLAIAAALLLHLLLGVARVGVLTARARAPGGRSVAGLLNQVREGEGVPQPVRVLESAAVTAPLSWGLLKPVVLLPEQGREWNEERLHNVLVHELSHIRRLDWLCHLLASVVCAMYWYNPLVWLASRRMREEAERACDDAVVMATTIPGRGEGRYAEDLLEIARGAGAGGRRRLIADAMVRSFLGRRVVAILDPLQPRARMEEVHFIRGLLAALSLVMVAASVRLVPEVDIQAFRHALTNLITVNLRSPVEDGGRGTETVRPPVQEGPPRYLPITGFPPEQTVLVESPVASGPQDLESLAENIPLPLISMEGAEAPGGPSTSLARPLAKRFPRYPAAARARGIEGHAVIQYDLDARGRVRDPFVLEASPRGMFERVSLEAIEGYRYDPPRFNGEAVGVQGLRTRFVFRLNPSPG